MKGDNSHVVPVVASWLECATRFRKTLGSIPGRAALFFRLVWLSVLLSLSELKELIFFVA